MDNKPQIDPNEIQLLLYENAEKSFIHTTHLEDMQRFYYLQEGDMRAVEEAARLTKAELQGKLSSDPIRNYKYLCIISIALASRFVIESGIPLEKSYAISDLYIQRMDATDSLDELRELLKECYTTYVKTVQEYKKSNHYSKPIMICLNYIMSHFNEKISLEDLARETNLHPNYLSALFKKETGETLREYLIRNRINVAKSLLTRTEYTYIQISNSLAFYSQSHFTQVFKERTGFTPKQYRMKYYDSNFSKLQQ